MQTSGPSPSASHGQPGSGDARADAGAKSPAAGAASPDRADRGEPAAISLDGSELAPLDRVFPVRPRPFLGLVVVVALGAWLAGLALAPDKAKFLASAEWQFMPFYLAAHIVAVRLFISTYTRNFHRGIEHFEVEAAQAARGVRSVLGPVGLAAAIVIAAPFCYLDYLYMTAPESRYSRMGEAHAAAVDLLMWGTWVIEWVLNALIWVMLVAFLVKNCTIIQKYPFRAPIEIAVHERHYRPFLQMSAQGATIVLGFGMVTILYLWATGGELTDYAGLAITAGLLLTGFLPPWLLLRHKVRAAVERETGALRNAISRAMWRDQQARKAGQVIKVPMEQRLEEALAIFRITHLEQLKLNLGRAEARAIAIRLVAPFVGVAWQLTQNLQTVSAHFQSAWHTFKTLIGN
jgi:hypothetical protein